MTTAVVFFPVTFLYGVSKFLFTSLAIAVVLALFSSYFIAITVVPLFCARFVRREDADSELGSDRRGWAHHFNDAFNRGFERLLNGYTPAGSPRFGPSGAGGSEQPRNLRG